MTHCNVIPGEPNVGKIIMSHDLLVNKITFQPYFTQNIELGFAGNLWTQYKLLSTHNSIIYKLL